VEDIKKLVGEQIRRLRKYKGFSQEELGARAELHYTYVGAVERGEKNCSIESLNKIAQGLDINIGELFSFNAEKDEAKIKKEMLKRFKRRSPEIIEILSELIKILESQSPRKHQS
jgi:transcriptional regulator with XRE-family HTH domain